MELQSHRGEIHDVMHGKLYKELFDGSHFRGTPEGNKEQELHISLQMNTDGVSVFKSSKFSIWPVYFTINELSPKIRFTRSSRIFGGLWFGTLKPDMKIFVRPFVDQLKSLYNEGFKMQFGESIKTVKTVLLSAVFDAPARCSVQDFIQFNGYYGCATCYAPGESVSTGNGSTHVYPFDMSKDNKKNGHPSTRTHDETLQYAKEAEEEEKTINGVKGYSWLLKIPRFNVIRGISIDYMHCVLLGVMKMLLKLWTNSKHRNEAYYIGNRVAEIDQRLSAVSPPNCVSRLPRSLKDLGQWKASELRSFLLFYSIPVLHGLLPQEHFDHFLCLVHAITLLLQSSITKNELKQARRHLHNFCLMFDCMYSSRYESSNIHSLLHLHEKVRDLGPLWAQSCFFYEDLNGDLRKLFHGTQKIELQIVNSISIQQRLPELTNCLESNPSSQAFHKSMTTHHKIRKKIETVQIGIYAVENFIPSTMSDAIFTLICEVCGHVINAFKFERLLWFGQVLHCKSYAPVKRRNSYTVCYMSQNNVLSFGIIRYYVRCQSVDGDTIYLAIIDELEIVPCDVNLPKSMKAVKLSDSVTVVTVDRIQALCMYMDIPGQDSTFVSLFPNKCERD